MFHQQFVLQFGVMLPDLEQVICLLQSCKALNNVVIQHQPKRDLILSLNLAPKRTVSNLCLGKCMED